MSTIKNPLYPTVPRVQAVKPLAGFRVHLVFSDGVEKDVDLKPYLSGPIFEPIRNDPRMFAAVRVDEEGDTIVWPNGADIAPETLYYDGDPPWAVGEQDAAETRQREKRPLLVPS